MAKLWESDKQAAATFRGLLSTWIEELSSGGLTSTDCSPASNEAALSREFAELSLQNDPAPLAKVLRAHLETSALGGKQYVPRDALAKRLTRSRVAGELRRHEVEFTSIVEFILNHAITVFAILVMADLVSGARDLEKYDITDACLPLEERDDQIRPIQETPAKQGVSKWFETDSMRDGASAFIHHQWRLYTPVFRPEQTLLRLRRDTALPFIEYAKDGLRGTFGSICKARLQWANQTAFPKVLPCQSSTMNLARCLIRVRSMMTRAWSSLFITYRLPEQTRPTISGGGRNG